METRAQEHEFTNTQPEETQCLVFRAIATRSTAKKYKQKERFLQVYKVKMDILEKVVDVLIPESTIQVATTAICLSSGKMFKKGKTI